MRISRSLFFMFGVFWLANTIPAKAQHGHNHSGPLQRIQEAYNAGKIDVETAVLEQFRIIYAPEKANKAFLLEQNEIVKCATPAFIFYRQHKSGLSVPAKMEIEQYQTKAIENTAADDYVEYIFTSASGKFSIHYYLTGSNAVPTTDNNGNTIPDYVEEAGVATDSAYHREIELLGFPDPIPANYTYAIYITNLYNVYGVTNTTSSSIPGPKTNIKVDNDFIGFPSNTDPDGNQLGALRVTIAHEFKHAIQFAQAHWSGESDSWLEMDATLMEEVVYDQVNDYYNYIANFDSDLFSKSSTSLIPGSYEDITWALYFYEKYGNTFWTKAWEIIESDPENVMFLDAVAQTLSDYGNDFNNAATQAYLWHLASGSRAGNDMYGFDEKHVYPDAKLQLAFEGVPDSATTVTSLRGMSARYFEVIPNSGDQGIIDLAVNLDSTLVGIGLLLYLDTGEQVEYIYTGENKHQLYLPTTYTWQTVDRAAIALVNYRKNSNLITNNMELLIGKDGARFKITDPDYAYIPDKVMVYQNYPNPFNPKTTIQFDLNQPAYVKLDIFDITGRKVTTLLDENRSFGIQNVVFDAHSLASGMYLYRLQIDKNVYYKKMTLLK